MKRKTDRPSPTVAASAAATYEAGIPAENLDAACAILTVKASLPKHDPHRDHAILSALYSDAFRG